MSVRRTLPAFLLSLLFAASTAFAECPKYTANGGWGNGKTVFYELSGVSAEFQAAATKAFKEWTDDNTKNNDSGVVFAPWAPGASLDITVVEGPTDPKDAGETDHYDNPDITFAKITVDTSASKFTQSDRATYFMKIMLHEIGHTMGLDDVPVKNCGDNAGVSVMNLTCAGSNDSEGMLPTSPTPCDNGAVKKDPRRNQKKDPPRGDPDNCRPCAPQGGRCEIRRVCEGVAEKADLECYPDLVCQPAGKDPTACCGSRASAISATEPCGSWDEIDPLPGGFGDYACRNPLTFEVQSCAEAGLLSAPACGADVLVEITVPGTEFRCYRCPGVVPPLPPDPSGGGCVPQTSCGFSTGQGCAWMPDGCGGQHLCGVCGTACGVDMAGNIIPCDGGGGSGGPTCDGAHNETCYPSFKACSDECCGVCERRIGCGGESAHKCFEP